ncbi:MAG: hypothetical protein AAFR05_14005 [Bacteroidota bacterium]
MKIESKYKLGIVKNGKPFYGEVILEIESLPDSDRHEVVEKYSGKGFKSQGYVESIPPEGYDAWKIGIKTGVEYALKRINDSRKFKVTILESNGLTTDTNPIILAYVSSRAILKEFANNESETDLNKIEEIVFNSWSYEYDTQISFDKLDVAK